MTARESYGHFRFESSDLEFLTSHHVSVLNGKMTDSKTEKTWAKRIMEALGDS